MHGRVLNTRISLPGLSERSPLFPEGLSPNTVDLQRKRLNPSQAREVPAQERSCFPRTFPPPPSLVFMLHSPHRFFPGCAPLPLPSRTCVLNAVRRGSPIDWYGFPSPFFAFPGTSRMHFPVCVPWSPPPMNWVQVERRTSPRAAGRGRGFVCPTKQLFSYRLHCPRLPNCRTSWADERPV